VLYARYSSDKQNDQSCEHQLALGRETAEKLGFEIAGEFSDHAISGRGLLRNAPRRLRHAGPRRPRETSRR
jgi:DNA invertase Pin-like site-specific DNA recombinase